MTYMTLLTYTLLLSSLNSSYQMSFQLYEARIRWCSPA